MTRTSLKNDGNRSLWNAPPNSRFEPLEALHLQPPTEDEVAAFRDAVRDETKERAKAYRTPVTEETLRRNLR